MLNLDLNEDQNTCKQDQDSISCEISEHENVYLHQNIADDESQGFVQCLDDLSKPTQSEIIRDSDMNFDRSTKQINVAINDRFEITEEVTEIGDDVFVKANDDTTLENDSETVGNTKKWPGIDNSKFIIHGATLNTNLVDSNLIPLHDEPNPKISNLLKNQLFIPDVIEEEKYDQNMSEYTENVPVVLKPIISYIIEKSLENESDDACLPCFFKINEQTDNLIYNQDCFSFYTKYTTHEIINNDKETKFLCEILSQHD